MSTEKSYPHKQEAIDQPVLEILESISDAFFALDREWRFTYLNQAAIAILQESRDELLGKNVWEAFPEAVGSLFDQEYHRAVAEGATVHFESYYEPFGKLFEVRAYPTPGGLSVYFRDITERMRLHEEMRYAEECHRKPFETMAQGVVFHDSIGQVTYSNPAAGRILGLTSKQLATKSTFDDPWRVIREDGTDFPVPEHPVYVALRTNQEVQGVVMGVINPLIGECRWIIVNAVPLTREGETSPSQVYASFDDITERKRAEDALFESQKFVNQILETTPEIVYVYDLISNCNVYCNREISKILGYSPEQVKAMGSSFLPTVLHPDDLFHYTESHRLWENVKDGQTIEVEYRMRHANGAWRWLACRMIVFNRTPDGRVAQVLGTAGDITARKEAESALVAAKEEAERTSHAKDEFIAILSHELRTPLTPVLLATSMIASHPKLPEELRHDLATIRRNVELESRLIGDLLDLTRIAKGKLELELEVVDAHMLIRLAIDICQREDAVPLVLELGANHHYVKGDSTRIQQIFWNLINNAQKFTPASGMITVRTLNPRDSLLRVEVSDTGAGIDAELIPKLFEAFEQGDTRDQRTLAGLGLGLAISKRLVDAHGGTISCASKGKGHGATFVLELPLAQAIDRGKQDLVDPPVPDVSDERLHVLLVEDHEPTLRIMTRLLVSMGHRVTAAASLAAARASCNQQDFDLLLSDLGLPDGSGLDLIRQVKDRYKGRAIALTGYGMDSDIVASQEAGFTRHITKPIDRDTLENAIANIVKTSYFVNS